MLQCPHCDKTYLWNYSLTKHLQNVHKELGLKSRDFPCDRCDKAFYNQKDLSVHRKHVCYKDELASILSCPYCPITFTLKSDYDGHVARHTKVKLHQCNKCGLRYATQKSLNKHLKSYCKRKLQEPIDDPGRVTLYQGIEIIHSDNEDGFTLRCSCCEFIRINQSCKNVKRGDTYASMRLHIDSKHLLRFKCKICDKQLSEPKVLRKHMLSYHPAALVDGLEATKKLLVRFCEVCGKPFRSPNASGLYKHAWSHLSAEERQARIDKGDKPPKSYAEKVEEQRSAGKSRSFICDQCGIGFLWQSGLKKHTRRVHGDLGKNFQCTQCGKFYVTADGLNSHVKHVHDKDKVHKWHYCSLCERKFSQTSGLNKHMKSHERGNLKNIGGGKGSSSSRSHGKVFECDDCGKEFQSQRGLNAHEKVCRNEGGDSEESDDSQPMPAEPQQQQETPGSSRGTLHLSHTMTNHGRYFDDQQPVYHNFY
jgi:KRAB domain-containing zinc finger protein